MDNNMLLGMISSSQPQPRMGSIGSAKTGQGDFFARLLQQISQDGNEEYAKEIAFSPVQLMNRMNFGKTGKVGNSEESFAILLQQVSQLKNENSDQLINLFPTQSTEMISIGKKFANFTESSNTSFNLEELLAALKVQIFESQKASTGVFSTSDVDKLPSSTTDKDYKWLMDLQSSPQAEAKKIIDGFEQSDELIQLMAMLLLPQYQQDNQQINLDPSQVVTDVETKEFAQGFLGKVFAEISDHLQKQDFSKGKIDISDFQQVVEMAINDVVQENKQPINTFTQTGSDGNITELIDNSEALRKELAEKIVLYVDHEVNKSDQGFDYEFNQQQIVEGTVNSFEKLASEQNTDFFSKEGEKQLKKEGELADKSSMSSEFAPIMADNLTITRPVLIKAEQVEPTNLPPKEEIIRQIVDKASLHKEKSASEMHIQLNPEHLGKVIMKIRVEAGTVTAQFLIDNQQTKDMVQANIFQLKQALTEQGIKVNEVSVALGGHNFMQQHSEGRNQSGRWGEQKGKNLKGGSAKQAIDEIEKTQLITNPIITGHRKFIHRDIPRMSFDSMA